MWQKWSRYSSMRVQNRIKSHFLMLRRLFNMNRTWSLIIFMLKIVYELVLTEIWTFGTFFSVIIYRSDNIQLQMVVLSLLMNQLHISIWTLLIIRYLQSDAHHQKPLLGNQLAIACSKHHELSRCLIFSQRFQKTY